MFTFSKYSLSIELWSSIIWFSFLQAWSASWTSTSRGWRASRRRTSAATTSLSSRPPWRFSSRDYKVSSMMAFIEDFKQVAISMRIIAVDYRLLIWWNAIQAAAQRPRILYRKGWTGQLKILSEHHPKNCCHQLIQILIIQIIQTIVVTNSSKS